ncbi:MAG: PEP-CTERM sorting domain-containing protein [Planctomycetaceae bacterium]|nr:PEP-CTERM sorting domain-containing protein [Planctomycetaceae bacterium]
MSEYRGRAIWGAMILASLSCLPADAALVVGAFDASRAGAANVTSGDFSTESMSLLQAEFVGTTFATSPSLTPEFLAGVDILILTPASSATTAIAPLSTDEQDALLGFVKAGGRALLLAEGENPFIPVAATYMALFGVTLVDDGLTGLHPGESIAPAHPIINGPFGEVAGALFYGHGKFSDLGPYATPLAKVSSNGDITLAAIESGALGPGSGRVVLMADSTPFFDSDDGGFFVLGEHQALFLNTIQFLSVPEPTTQHLLAVGGGLAAIGAALGRRRRSPQHSSGA